ncbi:MAG: acyl-CoA dehydrogenase family protein [Deltaproteobacteria bacterium]|nr:acyl-CoA dehydrogenase family protein [Deltaproteobacteria bacterium]MBW2413956.1 acyl-CoA dehydrogenase family protein [Deltaproteobacteria bacterium]
MIEWSEEHLAFRDALRRFIDAEIVPNLEELEHGDTPPYDVLRKLYSTFGLTEMQRSRGEAVVAASRKADEARARGEEPARRQRQPGGNVDAMAMQLLLIKELCRFCPGMVTAMGVSTGLTGGALISKGTTAQKERWLTPILTLEKIGAWAITEPGSGSDAFGGMKATACRDGDGYVLNGNKTFITNGPYADTIVFICKLDEGDDTPQRDRRMVSFVLDRGMPGLTQSKPMRKMGLHSSPTGELFLQDVRAGRDRLIGESESAYGRGGAKETFGMERTGVVAMTLGMVERCLELCTAYAKERVQWDKPIGEYQLIQLKLAKMEVARMNLENLLFRQIELAGAGRSPTLAEASAGKLYAAQTCMEVMLEGVQLFGGNGYMAEYQIEQLCRDAKVMQIYAGTDEIQITHIARELLRD